MTRTRVAQAKRCDVIIGMGEIGSVLYALLDEFREIGLIAEDIDPLKKKANIRRTIENRVDVIHICFPYSKDFIESIQDWTKIYRFREMVIHSTVRPGTTEELMAKYPGRHIIYSPIRGVHSRMLTDLRRYTKFWAGLEEPQIFLSEMQSCGIKTKRMANTTKLELAKTLVDTSYYGWLIVYAQHTKMILAQYDMCAPEDWNEMWEFADEIQEYLGNRPKMYPGQGIGGHCILPNLDLLKDPILDLISFIDARYRRFLKEVGECGSVV